MRCASLTSERQAVQRQRNWQSQGHRLRLLLPLGEGRVFGEDDRERLDGWRGL